MMKISSLAIITIAMQAFQFRWSSATAADKTALLMVDVQNCFCEAGITSSGQPGSLSVEDTNSLIPILNSLREEKSCLFDSVVRSQDFHPTNHISFGPTHGLEPFSHLSEKGELPLVCVTPESGLMTDASCCPTYHVDSFAVDCEIQLCPATATDAVLSSPACSICKEKPDECFETTQAMWTNHCLQDGDSDFPKLLMTLSTDIIVKKGTGVFVDAYSAFSDNTKRLKSDLDNTLKNLGVQTLYVVGIATDFCVYYSVLDALELGYDVKIIKDATRGIVQESIDAALADMAEKGAEIITVADVMATECPTASSEPTSTSASASFANGRMLGAAVGSFLAAVFGILV